MTIVIFLTFKHMFIGKLYTTFLNEKLISEFLRLHQGSCMYEKMMIVNFRLHNHVVPGIITYINITRLFYPCKRLRAVVRLMEYKYKIVRIIQTVNSIYLSYAILKTARFYAA